MKFRKIESGKVIPDLTPMVGMIFLLLMFFLVVMHFENTKADERMKLPVSALAKPPAVKPEHELVLNLSYRRDVKGQRLTPLPEVLYNASYVNVQQVAGVLRQERRIMEKVYGIGVLKDVTVRIRADQEVPAGLVQELVKQCQENGFARFSFNANGEEV